MLSQVLHKSFNSVPVLDTDISLKILQCVCALIEKGAVSACHDVSDGGLMQALAEMSYSGIGAEIDLSEIYLTEKKSNDRPAGITDDVANCSRRAIQDFLQKYRRKNGKVFMN